VTRTEQLRQDFHYVRQAVDRRGGSRERTPRAIPILWGLFVLVSFALLDLHPRAAAWMFSVGAPLLAVASGLIGRAAARREGELNRRVGLDHAMHWGTIFLGMIALGALAAAGRVRGEGVGQVATIIVGVVYFLAGVHFDRNWLVSGVLLIFGAAAITFVPRYPWTLLGAVVCLAIAVPAFLPRRSTRTAQTLQEPA
jgi:hypothetical protein